MSETKFKSVKISKICEIADADKTITKAKARAHLGVYPVYAGTVGRPFAYMDTYNNEDPCLVVVNDGAAGSTYIVNDSKYTIGKHATGLIPKKNIDLIYLQKVATPVFLEIAKGYGLGNLPKTDVLDAVVNIPVKNDEYDIELQKHLASAYLEIEDRKGALQKKLSILKDLNVILPNEENVSYANVRPIELFYPKAGSAEYSKTWAKDHSGNYPLYSGTTSGPYGYVDIAEYDGEYLSWCIDGLAGYLMYHDEKFTVTCHRGVLEKRGDVDFSKINLKYLKYVMEAIFRKNKKGREGDLGKNEYTSLKPVAIKRMADTVPIPLDHKGEYDLRKQKELADKYERLEIIKKEIVKKIEMILDADISIN